MFLVIIRLVGRSSSHSGDLSRSIFGALNQLLRAQESATSGLLDYGLDLLLAGMLQCSGERSLWGHVSSSSPSLVFLQIIGSALVIFISAQKQLPIWLSEEDALWTCSDCE